jgi:hypothetical protein
VGEHDISRNMDWASRADCMAFLVTEYNSDIILWGHLMENVYAVRFRTTGDLVARLQAAVTTVDASMLRCVRENAVRRTAVCLKWMKPASDTYCKYEVLIV